MTGISRITITNNDGKELDLSLDEAEALHIALDGLFGDEDEIRYTPYPVQRPEITCTTDNTIEYNTDNYGVVQHNPEKGTNGAYLGDMDYE